MMKHMNSSGQAVVVILLVAVVVSTIAFSIAGSSLKNIEQTATTEETNRAFSAAEAGIEEALYNLDQTGTIGTSLNNTPLQSGALIKDVSAQDQHSLVLDRLEQDDVAQVTLDGTVSQVRLMWDPSAAMVISIIDSNYNVTRYSSKCNSALSAPFSTVATVSGKCQQDVDVTSTDRIMRVRPMYADTSISVSSNTAGHELPVQSTIVTSTGKSGETERTVQVERTVPVAPAFFDYVLFSASGSLAK